MSTLVDYVTYLKNIVKIHLHVQSLSIVAKLLDCYPICEKDVKSKVAAKKWLQW